MDLRELAGFYNQYTQRSRQEVRAWCVGRGFTVPDGYFEAVLPNLVQTLFDLSHKVLIAQYQVIREKVSFQEYCAALCGDDVRAFMAARYPVMGRWLDSAAAHWVRQNCLFLERYTRDLDALSGMLGGGELRIAAVKTGLGDTHRGGGSVARIDLADGRTLIYKPRSLSIDRHFGELVAWLNDAGGMDLRVPRVLDRGDYGWVEFIDYAPCENEAEVARFYWRLGAWMALLYVLEGSDFHYENIIAAGGHPVPIDLESFFHPNISVTNGTANEIFDTSVLRTGILPNRVDLDAGRMPDVSGMSDPEGQQGLFKRLFMVRGEDGLPRFERHKGVMTGAHNVPQLDGSKVQAGVRQAPALQQGFRAMYTVLLAQRDALYARLRPFADDQVRVLFRNTAAYAHLLDEATHPSLLASEEAMASHFGSLALAVPQFPAAARFVPFEEAALQQRDVPLFSTRAASRDLWYSDDAFLPDFFDSSGMERVHANLARLSTRDMEHQCWIIDKALAMAASLSAPAPAAAPAPRRDYLDAGACRERLLLEAERVGDYIGAQVHETTDQAAWLVVKSASLDNRKMQLAPASYDLYSGMPGEILYLDQLARLTGKASYARLSRKILDTLLARIDEAPEAVRPLGLFIGWGGILHMLNTLSATESSMAQHARACLDRYLATVDFEALITEDSAYALLKGAAGFVLACAEVHRATGSARALALAVHAGEHLLAKRCAGTVGYSWRITSKVPLSGMAHGAAGFAMAFARLYAAGGEARWRHACLEALAYERTLFEPSQRNWRDCRDIATSHSDSARCEIAWAHGAAGIGLARVALLADGIGGPGIEADLDHAVRTTLAAGMGGMQSLIFGSCGRLELLLACQPFVAPALALQCRAAVPGLLQELDLHGWQLGERHFRPLGLMAGVTGIGYQALRAAFPAQVPSILAGASRVASRPAAADAA
jgi:type 2 lantibiotic biosynthesis protein LanM